MKFRSALVAPVIAFIAFTVPAYAEDDQNPQQATSGQQNRSGQPGIQNPEERDGKNSREKFEHQVNESKEGFEIIQFVLVGGALAIAVLLAYNAGKRSRKKRLEE